MPDPSPEFHGWFAFWINLLYVALSLFAVVAIVVTIKGWQEIKVMLSRLRESADDQDASDG